MIDIDVFYGMAPAVSGCRRKGAVAKLARDVKLWHGDLRPWREPKEVFAVQPGKCSFHRIGCCWMAFDTCVSVAHDRGPFPKVAITGRKKYAEFSCDFGEDAPSLEGDCTPNWCRLGVPCPSKAPKLQVTDHIKDWDADDLKPALQFVERGFISNDDDSNVYPIYNLESPLNPNETDYNYNGHLGLYKEQGAEKWADQRMQPAEYVYTYVNSCCQEGRPSWPSMVERNINGEAMYVFGFETPPPEYCITHIRVYRLASGFLTGREQAQEQNSEYLLVGEYPIGTQAIFDQKSDAELGEALSTRDVTEPPEGLKCIKFSTEANRLVAFKGHSLYVSSPNEWHSWPEESMITLDDEILGIAEHYGLVYVVTKGKPYTVNITGDCNGAKCFDVYPHTDVLPGVSCCCCGGITATPFGAVYPSTAGLVVINGKNSKVVTGGADWELDDWSQLSPHAMRLEWSSMYGLFMTNGEKSWLMQMKGGGIEHADYGHLTEISDKIRDLYVSPNGVTYLMTQEGIIKQWDAGDKLRPYVWESSEFRRDRITSYAGASVIGEGLPNTTISLLSKDTVVSTRPISGTRKNFRIPATGRHGDWRVRFEGTGIVSCASIKGAFSG